MVPAAGSRPLNQYCSGTHAARWATGGQAFNLSESEPQCVKWGLSVCPCGFYFLLHTFFRDQIFYPGVVRPSHYAGSVFSDCERSPRAGKKQRTGPVCPRLGAPPFSGPGKVAAARGSGVGKVTSERSLTLGHPPASARTPPSWGRRGRGRAWRRGLPRGGAGPAWEDGSPQPRGGGRTRIPEHHVFWSRTSGAGGRENPAPGSFCFL